MLVNATEMLIKARDGHYGVPQFNINNLEWTKAVLPRHPGRLRGCWQVHDRF